MKTIDVIVVRIYLTEGSHFLNQIVDYLRDEANIRGVTVFRAISGFGETKDHILPLMASSLNLPLTLEFFDDDKAKVEAAITYLNTMVKPEHIVFWEAKANHTND